MIEFRLKNDEEFYVEILENKEIFLFNKKIRGKYKNILNTLKKFPNHFWKFYINEVPIVRIFR